MAWYNSSWLKRKAVTLTGGASGAQTDYQVKLTVTYDSDMLVDFDDLRFTKADGTTLLDTWLESKVDSTSAIVWVETDTPANTVEADIYMYYDNSGAAAAWDIGATMLDGDDFPGTSLDTTIWDQQYCNAAVSGGELTLDTFLATGGRYGGGIMGKIAMGPSCVTEMRIKNVNSGDGYQAGLSNNAVYQTDDSNCIVVNYLTREYGQQRNEGSIGLTGYRTPPTNTYINYEIVHNGTSVHYYYDGTQISGSPVTTNAPDETMKMLLSGDSTYSPTIVVDWIFAHKYAANPATYVFGSEETPSSGWSNKVCGVTSPARVISVLNASIGKVIGV